MYFIDGKVYIEEEDQCQTCQHFVQGVACPLIEALGMGAVTLTENMIVTNCGFYKEFKRTLSIVVEEETDLDDDDDDLEPPKDNIRKLRPR